MVKKLLSSILRGFLFCIFLQGALAAYPLRVTRMHRPDDHITIDLIFDVHAEDAIKNIRALDSNVDAYSNLLIQLNQTTPISLIWEHSKKIYLSPGDTFDIYDKRDHLIFINQIKPKICLQECVKKMGLDDQAENLFKAFYNSFTNDNVLFGKNISEQPRVFMDRLAMLLRVYSDIRFFASDEERNSITLYTMLSIIFEEISNQLQVLSDQNSKLDVQKLEDLKTNAQTFLISAFILIHKILLSETVPDKILANNTTLLHHDINDLKKMWTNYKSELNHFYTHEYYQLVRTFFVDTTGISAEKELISICKHIPNLIKSMNLIKDSMIEYELLFNALTSSASRKIIYAGYFHCINITESLKRFGFIQIYDIGELIGNEISKDLFVYNINTKAPTYVLEEKTLMTFKKELDLSEIQLFLSKDPEEDYLQFKQSSNRFYSWLTNLLAYFKILIS